MSEIEGVEVRIRRVAETLSDEILGKMGALEAQKAWHPEFEVVSHDDLLWADAIAWGSPTRFGNITAQMKTVWLTVIFAYQVSSWILWEESGLKVNWSER